MEPEPEVAGHYDPAPDEPVDDAFGDIDSGDNNIDFDDIDFDDTDRGEDPARHNALPRRVEAWRRRSVAGAMLTGVARGLGQVFEPEREQPAIVAEAPGEPLGPLRPVEAVLDPDDPSASTLVVRRWLMKDPDRVEGADINVTGADVTESDVTEADDT